MAAGHYVGLMSGTSLDGVDAVLMDFSDGRGRCLGHHHAPYDATIRADALALHVVGIDELRRAALLANRLARLYAETVNGLLAKVSHGGKPPDQVRAIGCHGQTVRHAPDSGYTIQLNNPALLAELTGIAVVADFRSRDVAAGGQGAPLVPAFHEAMFRSPTAHRVVLNVGGIANITSLAPGHPTTGFDCGPGNMLLDAWAQRHIGKPYDQDGQWAAKGRVLPGLLGRLNSHPFLASSPPKSCGREQFNLDWLDTQLKGDERAEDIQATLLELTVGTIADAIEQHCGESSEILVCGGGAHNGRMMSRLSERLPNRRVATTDFHGMPPTWVEAAAFAWLAWRTMSGEPGNLPAVTGARGPRVLGAIHPA